MLARRIGKGRDRPRMAEREGHAHVDHVGDRQAGFLARRRIEDRMGKGLQRQDCFAVNDLIECVEQVSGMSEEKIGQLRLIGAATAFGDDRGHRLEAMVLG